MKMNKNGLEKTKAERIRKKHYFHRKDNKYFSDCELCNAYKQNVKGGDLNER